MEMASILVCIAVTNVHTTSSNAVKSCTHVEVKKHTGVFLVLLKIHFFCEKQKKIDYISDLRGEKYS